MLCQEWAACVSVCGMLGSMLAPYHDTKEIVRRGKVTTPMSKDQRKCCRNIGSRRVVRPFPSEKTAGRVAPITTQQELAQTWEGYMGWRHPRLSASDLDRAVAKCQRPNSNCDTSNYYRSGLWELGDSTVGSSFSSRFLVRGRSELVASVHWSCSDDVVPRRSRSASQ